MSHSVDLKSEVHQLVINIKELLPTDDSSIIHQNSNLTYLPFDLRIKTHVAQSKHT